jgi:hypothetical protein
MTGLADIRPTAKALLDRYTEPTSHHSFSTYDHWYGSDGPLAPADVLLANLMSLRLGWRQVIPLFADGKGPALGLRVALDEALTQLSSARAFEDHDSVEDLEDTLAPVAAANEATTAVPGWTAVTVSKVLHRRRPHIVPVIDSRVRAFYGARQPAPLRRALHEDIRQNRGWLAEHAQGRRTPDGRPVSLLRIADILIWMA